MITYLAFKGLIDHEVKMAKELPALIDAEQTLTPFHSTTLINMQEC